MRLKDTFLDKIAVYVQRLIYFGCAIVALGASTLLYLKSEAEREAMLLAKFRSHDGLISNLLHQYEEDAFAHFGEPFRIELLREREKLIYWDFDPVLVQIHTWKTLILRITYTTKSRLIYDKALEQSFSKFGYKECWEYNNRVFEEEKTKMYSCKKRRTTIHTTKSSIHVYGYIFPKPKN